ncbi:hypothetical protein [Actinomadura vinacea]
MEINERVVPPDDQLADLALWLRDSSTGDWSHDTLRRLVKTRGWATGDDDPTLVRTGLPTGDARLLPAGLAVPVGLAAPSPLAQADCFRHVAQVVRNALGPASVAGSYGEHRPFNAHGPAWGNPYLRWLRPAQSVELRAGAHGPEVVLTQTDQWAEWLIRQGQGRPMDVTGFLGRLQTNDSAHKPNPANLLLPSPWLAHDWDVFERAFAAWLSTVSAEQHALGMRLVPAIHGATGLLLDIYPHKDRLLIAGAARSVDLPALGWTPGPLPDDPWDDYPEWRLIGGGIGRVDGKALARTAVDTARAVGLTSPTELKIMHGAQTETSEGDEYSLTFYGLGIHSRGTR